MSCKILLNNVFQNNWKCEKYNALFCQTIFNENKCESGIRIIIDDQIQRKAKHDLTMPSQDESSCKYRYSRTVSDG